jgi:biopolymer transport protein ExbD
VRIRAAKNEGVKLDMTPMIDIVFQLLVFFALTLRVAMPEGDLAMHPPVKGETAGPQENLVPPLLVVLRADEHGTLQSLELNGRPLPGAEQLHDEVERLVGHDSELAAQSEARLACDEHLAYEHTIAAVTALSGTRLPSGQTKPLVGRVRFVELR